MKTIGSMIGWVCALALVGYAFFGKNPPAQNYHSSGIPPAVISTSSKVVKISCIFQKYEGMPFSGKLDSTNSGFLVKDSLLLIPEGEPFPVYGSGFLWNDSLIVTANHVVSLPTQESFLIFGCKTLYVLVDVVISLDQENNSAYKVHMFASDPKNDIAILSLGKEAHARGLILNTKSLHKYDPVWTAGYPKGDNGVVISDQKIFYDVQDSAFANGQGIPGHMIADGHQKVMRISGGGGLSFGSSGGPILNEKGEVVGITISLDDFGNMCYAVPSELVLRLFEKNK